CNRNGEQPRPARRGEYDSALPQEILVAAQYGIGVLAGPYGLDVAILFCHPTLPLHTGVFTISVNPAPEPHRASCLYPDRIAKVGSESTPRCRHPFKHLLGERSAEPGGSV